MKSCLVNGTSMNLNFINWEYVVLANTLVVSFFVVLFAISLWSSDGRKKVTVSALFLNNINLIFPTVSFWNVYIECIF